MAWAVKPSLRAVLGRTRHGGASPALGGPFNAARSRVRLALEIEAAFVRTVEINTDMTLQDVRVQSTCPTTASMTQARKVQAEAELTNHVPDIGKGLQRCPAYAGACEP